MENKDTGFSKELEADIKFLGFIETVEGWARAVWKKNPQLLDFYTRTFLEIIGLSHPAVSDQAKKCADGQPY